jgi:hypothetical protein
MKIVIFTQHYYPENFRINYIIDELRKNNQLKVFTANPHYNLNNKVIKKYKKNYPYITKANNIEITRIPVFFQKKSHLSKILNYISYIFILSFYLLFSKKKSFDIVFVYATSPIFQCIPAILYKMKNKAPLIIWVQDLWPEVLYDLKIPFAKLISFFITPIVKWIYESSDIILCQSISFKKKISKLTSKKVLLYENPSDIFSENCEENYRVQKQYFLKWALLSPEDYKCQKCGVSTLTQTVFSENSIVEKTQKFLSLELHHRDSNHRNSLLTNLELL